MSDWQVRGSDDVCWVAGGAARAQSTLHSEFGREGTSIRLFMGHFVHLDGRLILAVLGGVEGLIRSTASDQDRAAFILPYTHKMTRRNEERQARPGVHCLEPCKI